jgi:hypothetical protein
MADRAGIIIGSLCSAISGYLVLRYALDRRAINAELRVSESQWLRQRHRKNILVINLMRATNILLAALQTSIALKVK